MKAGRYYNALAMLIITGLISSLIPIPLWSQLLDSKAAEAVSADLDATTYLLSDASDLAQALQNTLPVDLLSKVPDATTLYRSDDQASGMLMNFFGMQTAINNVSQQPATLATPLSISRVQSAYTASDVVGNSLVITFTITNNQLPVGDIQLASKPTITDTLQAISSLDLGNDPHVIKNVILTNEILGPQATFVSSSPEPDRSGNILAWNLGSIPPLASITMTMKLEISSDGFDFIELDTGAASWGMLQGMPVSAKTKPLILVPNGFEAWLVCTIDANCDDEYVIAKTSELDYDPIAIFDYVRSLGYESYEGSLRGSRGALWSNAGNSMDKASLLIAMLRLSGIPSGYIYCKRPN
jgi:hypothetical protein